MLENVNPLIGRDEELERTIQILCRKDKNNPLHIGEPGVGKTAITYGLARMINEDKVPNQLKDGKIFSKEGSVGHILDCIDVRVDTPDENGCGEVIISGISIFDGYFEDPEETEKILRDGWLHTGDIGRIDEDRYLYIVGRSKNILILSNGENIIPEELEKAVSAIPEVKECLVFKKDEKLAVRIYAGTPEPELEKHLSDEVRKLNRTAPAYKQIRIVELAAEPLPKTSTGKLKRENFHA
jgi:long-chain acyl-CoA synthetase